MKITGWIVLLCLIQTALFGQAVKPIRISDEINLVNTKTVYRADKSGFEKVLGVDDSYAYLLMKENNDPVILKQNLNLNAKENTAYDVTKFLKADDVLYIKMAGSAIQVFYLKSKKDSVIYVRTIDKDKLELNNDEKTVFTAHQRPRTELYFFVKENKQKSRLLITAIYEGKKADKPSGKVCLVDNDLNVVLEKDFSINTKEESFFFTFCEVTESGNVIVGGKITKDDVKGGPGQPDYHYAAYDARNSREMIIDLKDAFINVNGFTVQEANGSLQFNGYYSLFRNDNMLGCFMMRFDQQTGETKETFKQPFKPDFLKLLQENNDFFTDHSYEKKGYAMELRNMIYTSTHVLSDGGSIMIGVHYHIIPNATVTTSNPSTGKTQIMKIGHMINGAMGDIIISKMSSNGAIEWAHKIDHGAVILDQYASYLMHYDFLENDKAVLFLNDALANKDIAVDKEAEGFVARKPSVTASYTFSKSGFEKKEILYTKDEKKGFIVDMKGIYKMKDDQYLLVGSQSMKSFRIAVLSEGSN